MSTLSKKLFEISYTLSVGSKFRADAEIFHRLHLTIARKIRRCNAHSTGSAAALNEQG